MVLPLCSENVCDGSLGVLRDTVHHFYESMIEMMGGRLLQSARDALSRYRDKFAK